MSSLTVDVGILLILQSQAAPRQSLHLSSSRSPKGRFRQYSGCAWILFYNAQLVCFLGYEAIRLLLESACRYWSDRPLHVNMLANVKKMTNIKFSCAKDIRNAQLLSFQFQLKLEYGSVGMHRCNRASDDSIKCSFFRCA
jgi:hypothetical protein